MRHISLFSFLGSKPPVLSSVLDQKKLLTEPLRITNFLSFVLLMALKPELEFFL